MNALLINPVFPPSFWTFESTCRSTDSESLIPPLGLMTLAALLPDRWDLRLVDLNVRGLTEEDWSWAEMVMISAIFIQKEGLLALIREAKARGKIVVAGGPYPTSVPEPAMAAGCDFVVRGEGEAVVPLFLAALESGKMPCIVETADRPDISLSPVPRFDLVNMKDYLTASVQTSRGCPFDCEFCDIVNLYGRKPRHKTPDQVIEELEVLYRLGWEGEVFISDDNFIGNKDHARAILEKLIPWMESHGMPFGFWTQTSVNLGQDREMIDLMTAANFWCVFIGVESPEEEVLTLNRKFQNIRNPLAESLININKNGLLAFASFVIGFDGEKPGTGRRICDFVDQTGIPTVVLNTLQVLPNTSLWDRLAKEGRLLPRETSGDTTGGRLNYVPTRPESEIMKDFHETLDYLYEPSRYLERAYRYYLTMRPTRRALGIDTPSSRSVSRRFRSLENFRTDVVRLSRLLWSQGIRSRHRLQFWRQLAGILMRNPSRKVLYLAVCSLGQNMFELREDMRGRA